MGLTATDIIKSAKFATTPTIYTNQTGAIDLSSASGFIVFNNTFANGLENAINLTCNTPNSIQGGRLTLVFANTLTTGSTVRVTYGSNLLGNISAASIFSSTGTVVVDFVLNNNSWQLSNIRHTNRLTYGTTTNRPVLGTGDAGYGYFDTTIGRLITWNGTAWLDPTAPATITATGVVKKSAALTSAAPANAAGANPTQAEFNAVVAYLNELVTKLQAAGIQS